MLPIFGLGLIFSIALCVHVVRTGQNMMWLYLILFLSPIGGIVYLIAVVVPSLTGGPTARKGARGGARDARSRPRLPHRQTGRRRQPHRL